MGIFFSPAKINLFFRVLRRRTDGFHEIASLYQAVDLGDELEICLSSQDSLTCSDPSLDVGEGNLVKKALNCFREHSGFRDLHISCHLIKNIPIGGGLGGGSSNAATVLFACNELTGGSVSLEELAKWGAEIGSDVSFFFSKGSAYCTGRGEIFEQIEYPLSSVFGKGCLIARPPFGISTKEVFRACDVRFLENKEPRDLLEAFLQGQPLWYNDLHAAVSSISPSFVDYFQRLKKCPFESIVLTGSGSCVLCFGHDGFPLPTDFIFYPVEPIFREEKGWYKWKKMQPL